MASQPVNIAKPSSNGQNAYRRGNKSRSHSLSSFSPSSYDINQYANGAGQEKFDLASEKPKDILARISPFDLEDVGERVEYINPEVKNILITGGAGFIGSFLVRKLVFLYPEFNISVVDKLDYCGSLNSLAVCRGMPNYSFIKGDIINADFMAFILRERKIDTIFHLAAQTHVDNSFGDSFEFTKNNVMGTHVMLEAAKLYNIKRFIHVSTDEVYGEVAKNGPDLIEESIISPTNPYSATKAAAECLVKAYNKSFNVPTIITRSNNIYGPYQYPEKICSKFICSLLRGGKCYVHGDGSNSRKYLYAGDVAHALDLILHKGEISEVYNIGSSVEISNLDLAKDLVRRFCEYNQAVVADDTPTRTLIGLPTRRGSRSLSASLSVLSVEDLAGPMLDTEEAQREHIEHVEDRAFNDRRYAVDDTKLRDLGWGESVAWEDGVTKTIDWYRDHCEEWWGDITPALVPHPLKTLPNKDFSFTS